MCQQKTVYLCKHSSYRTIDCSAKKTQRNSCFLFAPSPPCVGIVSSRPSIQLCPDCLRNDREIWNMEAGERQRSEKAPSRYNISTQGFHAQLPHKPQAARLRLEPEQLDADISSGTRASMTDRIVPRGVDLSSVAADVYHLAQRMPLQQPSHLIPLVETTPCVFPVSPGLTDIRFGSSQTNVEELRAEARKRVLDGLGNFF